MRHYYIPALRATALGALIIATTARAEVDDLAPEQAVERSLAVDEVHAYQAENDGGAFRLIVEQHGIDLKVDVEVGGRRLGTIDGPINRWGAEIVYVEPAGPGTVRIEVRASQQRAAPGRYRLTLDSLPAPLEGARRDAEVATTAGARAAAAQSAEGRRIAAERYTEALAHWQTLGAQRAAARAAHALAALLKQLGEYDLAVEALADAAERWRRLGRDPEARTHEALALDGLGVARLELGEADAARAAFERSLALNRALEHHFEAATNRLNLGFLAHRQGALGDARALYQEALASYRRLDDLTFEAILLSNLGGVAWQLGEAGTALEHFERALEHHRAAENPRQIASVLNNQAALYRSIGEPENALELYRQVLEIAEETDDRRATGRAFNNLGYAYFLLGEAERARGYFERALALRRELGDRRGEATTLNNLGSVHVNLGELAEAVELHRQSLELKRQLGDRRGEMSLLGILGRELAELGDAAAAREHLERAVKLCLELDSPRATAWLDNVRARALLAMGDADQALPAADRAAALRRELGDRAGEAESLVVAARAARVAGNLDPARQRLDDALALLETLRARIGNPNLRAAFLAARRDAWELSVDLKMEQHRRQPDAGWDRAAFEAGERLRARALLDLLADAGAEASHGTDPELADRHRELVRNLSLKVGRQTGRRPPPDSAALAAEIEKLRAELDLLESRMRRQQPGWAALVGSEPLSATKVQRLLDDQTLLLAYFLGEERGFLWALTSSTLDVFELPARTDIEAAGRRVHEAWGTLATADRARQRAAAARLSEIALGPVADRLGPAKQRIAVVAGGVLSYVPFAALPLPSAVPNAAPGQRVIDHHEVVHLPSASVLGSREVTRTARRAVGPPTLTVLADPVFTTQDPRGPELYALPATRREAAAITAAAPAGSVTQLLGFDARRDAALGGLLRDASYIHFATHGVVDDLHPRLSGLALSRSDAEGRPIDGMLRLAEIYRLELDAELVVLSGCRTALGREIRGEGLIGLTRGFLYAGTRQVMASLWQVDDQATAELMERFYDAVLNRGFEPSDRPP